MEKLEQAIERISPLHAESRSDFYAAWKCWQLPKDHLLLRPNTISDYIYYIEKGVARIYYNKNDKDITEWIALEDQFFLSITSFFNRTPSHLGIQTIQSSIIYGIHHDQFMKLASQYHDVERLLRKMVTSSLILSQERMKAIQFETAQQRYQKLLQHSPQIIQQVPLSYIASFLGITLETLSRIRSQK
ncbi:MAG TPA: Crp/Fnr family transcriptional regulator [Flavisolibacter sp.]|nr:Crp/Fnr family transcriptional regulator [Flavisolibacter sp.]